MKRNLIAVCVFTGLVTLFFIAVSVVGFCYGVTVAGALGAVMAAISAWMLIGSVWREVQFERFRHKFAARDFMGAVRGLDGAAKNVLLFPVFRTVAYRLYMMGYTALGDTASAERYISALRHMGGAGWRFRTSFYFVLLNFAWEDISATREEFEEFRACCSHAAIYKEELEVLSALFAHIDGERGELPDSVKNSPYPAVHKIIERY